MEQPARLTHATFYKACEALKKHKQVFLDERPNYTKAAAMLSQLVGFTISPASIQEIREACGVEWEPRRQPPSQNGEQHKKHAVRTLTRAMRRLYRKLDEEIPESLELLYQAVDGRHEIPPCEDANLDK